MLQCIIPTCCYVHSVVSTPPKSRDDFIVIVTVGFACELGWITDDSQSRKIFVFFNYSYGLLLEVFVASVHVKNCAKFFKSCTKIFVFFNYSCGLLLEVFIASTHVEICAKFFRGCT